MDFSSVLLVWQPPFGGYVLGRAGVPLRPSWTEAVALLRALGSSAALKWRRSWSWLLSVLGGAEAAATSGRTRSLK